MSEVVYELSLRDMLTGKLKDANQAANKLEGSMSSLGQRILHVGEAFGISFALFKGIEFVHEGVEAFEKLHQAEAQVKAGLESTGHAAGIAGEELEMSARKFAQSFKFTRAEVTEMQSVMLTFPGITSKTFDAASQAILDMSTRLHKGLDETAIMVGKALQDPERGITAMRRVGVNFNNTQTEIIKNLVKTGHAAKAQTLILQELQLEFAGSAKAAAEADPLFRFNKLMGSLKMETGAFAVSLLHNLTPALEAIGNAFQEVVKWAKQLPQLYQDNKNWIDPLTGSVIAGTGAWMAYTLWISRASIASYIQTGITYGLGTAVYFLAGAFELLTAPITIIVLGIAAVGAGIVLLWKHCETFRAVITGLWELIKSFASSVADMFTGLWKIIKGVFTFDADLIKKGFAQSAAAMYSVGSEMGHAYERGFNEGRNNFRVDKLNEGGLSNTSAAPKDAKKPGMPKKEGPEIKPETKGAKGNKVVTINIHIDSLIKDFKISTNNIKEGTAKVQEMVTQVMMNAVNNSQIVAGQ